MHSPAVEGQMPLHTSGELSSRPSGMHGAASITLLGAALVGKTLQRASHASVWACSMDVDLSEQLRPRRQDTLPQATSSGAAFGEAQAVPARVNMAPWVVIAVSQS